jgi:hypothetical protein
MTSVSILLLALGYVVVAGPQDVHPREWQTQVKLRDGAAVLHWQGVYEGKETVVRIDIRHRRQRPVSIDVEGQPVFNATTTYVALPYCANDGCVPLIDILDLTTSRKLEPVRLAEHGQFYFTCRWAGDVLQVVVEAGAGVAPARRTYQFPIGGPR